ncbi:hypothetical protein KY347_04305 [Candidatus Woesearchaeota archaeon]|nr:hypothetical protein [Candidatus Woesearchaeota archaeon]
MTFEKKKKDFLRKKDKSRKGSIDGKIKKLVNRINSFGDFYTTSSCSGRILLLAIPESNKKNEVKYLFCSHKKIKYNELEKALPEKLPKNIVWFRVEPAILHIACRNLDSALRLLNTARNIGFRRSGIISAGKNRIVMEIISTEKIDAIAGKKSKLLIGKNYFKILVEEGNKKLERTWKKIGKLDKELERQTVQLEE